MIGDRYSLEREIARGGMGAVWLGRDELLGRPVALKRVGVAPGGSDPEIARAEREAKLAASLSHPNVVSVFDLAPDGELQWLVMEYVEGTNLAELVRANGSLSADEAAPILAQVASALVAAHAAGVVHRDVKPSNILVTPDGQVKLSDFGIARTKGDPSLTQTGLVTGSPAYLSPEVASGRSASDKSDVWSLGATAYHAIEGHPPYEVGDNLIGALYRIVHEEPPRPAAPGWLTPLFEHTMERDDDARWDAVEVRDFLEAGPGAARATATTTRERRVVRSATVVPDHHTQVLPPLDATTRVTRPPRGRRTATPAPEDRRRSRLPWLLSAAALVLVLLLAGLVWTLLGDREPADTATDPNTPEASPSAPVTSAPPTPSADGIEQFVRTYLETAPTDQRAGFAMLTPAYQQASDGLEGYRSFWGGVSDVVIESIRPDPENLTVTYTYSYRSDGEDVSGEVVTLELAFEDGTYRIADDL